MWNGDRTVKHKQRQTFWEKRKTSGKIIKPEETSVLYLNLQLYGSCKERQRNMAYLLYEEVIALSFPPEFCPLYSEDMYL